jgi:hypothetical protein
MPLAKPLTKEDILRAMAMTKSNLAAARYLHCSKNHYKMYAKLYKDENGVTLWDKHLNQSGKGIPKFLNNSKKEPALKDIIEGRVPMTNYKPEKVRSRLVKEGYLKEECYICGFHERRVSDYKMPLVLDFIDKNKTNYNKDNIRLLCYNCYYLHITDLFTDKQIIGMEDYVPVNESAVDWELDEYTEARLKELGLYSPPPLQDDGAEFISKW